MQPGCIEEDRLPLIMQLPPDDPARRHVAGCARCRARVAGLSAFENPVAIPAGSRADEADRRLAAILDREIYGQQPGRRVHLDSREQSRKDFGSILRRLWHPTLRPVWVAGIVVIGIVGVRELTQTRDDRIVLREDGRPSSSAVTGIATQAGPDGQVALRWDAVAGATAYTVVLLGADLEEQDRIDAGSTASCPLPEARVTAVRGGAHTFWRVLALRDGDFIATSKTVPLVLPATP
jgi:hypothetical protein